MPSSAHRLTLVWNGYRSGVDLCSPGSRSSNSSCKTPIENPKKQVQEHPTMKQYRQNGTNNQPGPQGSIQQSTRTANNTQGTTGAKHRESHQEPPQTHPKTSSNTPTIHHNSGGAKVASKYSSFTTVNLLKRCSD